jgi:hypothetical protein
MERWRTEITLVQHEMTWTVRFYQKRRDKWEERAKKSEEAEELGHACYAWEQVYMWDQFVRDAKQAFMTVVNLE